MKKKTHPTPLSKSNIDKIQNEFQEEIIELESKIQELRYICMELNPYREIPDHLKMKLLELNIVELKDPFKVTNALLTMLENAMDELHALKPFLHNEDAKSDTIQNHITQGSVERL